MLTAFTAGLLLITISELGDKTFFIAVVMSMRYRRRWVLIGAIAALATMTLLSVLFGRAVSFLPKTYLVWGEICLFLIFGAKLWLDARKMPARGTSSAVCEAQEAVCQSKKNLKRHRNHWAVIIETFILTFLAEWGDRTQIATIALAASNNAVGVSLGAIRGHSICASIAVIGGKLIAGRISEKTINILAGALFFLFAAIAGFEQTFLH